MKEPGRGPGARVRPLTPTLSPDGGEGWGEGELSVHFTTTNPSRDEWAFSSIPFREPIDLL